MNKKEYSQKCQELFDKAKKLGIELQFNPNNFDYNRLDCIWYGGHIATIDTHIDNILINIECAGDVIAILFNDEGEEICFVKDKGNNGRFYDEMCSFIFNDEELVENIENQKLLYYNNNWIEYNGEIVKGNSSIENDIVMLEFTNILDDNNILNAIDDVITNYAIIVEEIKEEMR